MISLTYEGLTFKEIESNFFEIGCEVAKTLMQEFLEKTDKQLEKNRDTSELRHKGARATTIKTLMGEVSVQRVLYKRINEDGTVEYIFLLDESLGFDTIGNVSPNLVEKMAFAGYMKPEEFKTLRDAAIKEKYNTDEIVYKILNGDGAPWIRNGHNLETDRFQLDSYHLAECVVRNVYDKQARRHIMRWLRAGEIEKVFEKIEKLKYERWKELE